MTRMAMPLPFLAPASRSPGATGARSDDFSKGDRMLISFVVPAYNEEVLLADTLAAIRAEIARCGLVAGCDAEIIVVDNASTDGTGAIARAWPDVSLVEEPRKGLVAARWAGFVASSGALIANVDADTVIPPGWLDRVRAHFAADPNLVALSGPYVYADLALGKRVLVRVFYRLAYLVYLLNHRVLRVGAMLQGGNFVVRRTAMERLGAANDRFSFYGEDTDLARRLGRIGRVIFTFELFAQSSGRRLTGEGLLTIGLRYAMNFFWATFLKKPFTTEWRDIRDPPIGQEQ